MNDRNETIAMALAERPKDGDPVTSAEYAVERMGDYAFDYLLAAICDGQLSGADAIRALQLMVRLSREMCVRRRPDLLDLVLDLCRGSEADVRSIAAEMAVGIPWSSASPSLRGPDTHARVVAAVRGARALGLSPESLQTVDEFLVGSPDR